MDGAKKKKRPEKFWGVLLFLGGRKRVALDYGIEPKSEGGGGVNIF